MQVCTGSVGSNSKGLRRSRWLRRWKPRRASRNALVTGPSKTRYAVVYFLHGMGGNESADAAGFSGYVAKAIHDLTLPPAICVFRNGGRSGYRGEVESLIVKELIPLIDRDYPTRASTSGRAVAGFSMGRAGAVRLSLLRPELFAVAGSWGGGLWRAPHILGL